MLTRAKYMLAGLALAVALSAAADQFPSQPIFQALTVNCTGGTFKVSGANVSSTCSGTVPWSTAGAVGYTYVANNTAGTTRSTVTQSCDSSLTISNVAGASSWYQVHAVLEFSGNGVTTNGWKVNLAGTAATPRTVMSTASQITAASAVAPLSQVINAEQGSQNNNQTQLFNAAGIDNIVVIDGVVQMTSATNSICVNWAQNTASGTNTTLFGSMTATRLQ